jgi:hypothetical protein
MSSNERKEQIAPAPENPLFAKFSVCHLRVTYWETTRLMLPVRLLQAQETEVHQRASKMW